MLGSVIRKSELNEVATYIVQKMVNCHLVTLLQY